MSAKEIRVISVATLIYGHNPPLGHEKKIAYLRREENVLNRIIDRVIGSFNKAFEKYEDENESREVKILNRLKISLKLRFSVKELHLIQKALRFYINEIQYLIDKNGNGSSNGFNAYHNASEYGVLFEDFHQFNKRLNEIIKSEQLH